MGRLQKKFRKMAPFLLGCGVISAVGLIGCSRAERTPPTGQPFVLTTFTILQDLTRMVAGDIVEVRTLTPIGGEVHEWELIPSNFADIERAALILYNGYELEGWMDQVRAIARPGTPVVAVAEASDYPTIPIRIGELEGRPDPHLWMHPQAAQAYLQVIRDRLIAIFPEHRDTFIAQTDNAQENLSRLYTELQQQLADIPRAERVLITSEAAFLYFADAFQFEHDAIWGSNDEEEGTPRQIARIIRRIRSSEIPVAFYESTISDRHVRSVAEETGIRVAGPLFVDSLGPPNSGAASYADLMRHNVNRIRQALAQE